MIRIARFWGILTICALAMLIGGATRIAQAQQPAAPGAVCVMVFEDQNQSKSRDLASEGSLPDVNIDLMMNGQTVIANYVTEGQEPYYCFENLAAQEYSVSFS